MGVESQTIFCYLLQAWEYAAARPCSSTVAKRSAQHPRSRQRESSCGRAPTLSGEAHFDAQDAQVADPCHIRLCCLCSAARSVCI